MQKAFGYALARKKIKKTKESKTKTKTNNEDFEGAKQDAAHSRKITLLGLGFCITACWVGVVQSRRGSSRLDSIISIILPRGW